MEEIEVLSCVRGYHVHKDVYIRLLRFIIKKINHKIVQ